MVRKRKKGKNIEACIRRQGRCRDISVTGSARQRTHETEIDIVTPLINNTFLTYDQLICFIFNKQQQWRYYSHFPLSLREILQYNNNVYMYACTYVLIYIYNLNKKADTNMAYTTCTNQYDYGKIFSCA